MSKEQSACGGGLNLAHVNHPWWEEIPGIKPMKSLRVHSPGKDRPVALIIYPLTFEPLNLQEPTSPRNTGEGLSLSLQ